MDFFERQEIARRTTARLIAYFVIAVVTIVAAVYVAAVFILFYLVEDRLGAPFGAEDFWNPTLLVPVVIVVLGIIALGSLYQIARLKRGGEAVAEALGATLVASDSRAPQERQLMNVVAEMAIASGTPMPSVYVLQDEMGINAFAAGHTPSDAVVAVTRGALDTLSRDGLQSVIAHEFSHILNGDMRLNIRLMGVLHGILLISLSGRFILRGTRFARSSRGKSANAAIIILICGITLYVIGYIGVIFGRLIKAAVSRQREFLADAAAVQFTRNADGLAGALKKIGGLAARSTLNGPNAEMASHLYFADGLAAGATSPFATHPPLDERIRCLDPHWDGTYPRVKARRQKTKPKQSASASEPDSPVATGPWSQTAVISKPMSPAASVALAGTLNPVLVIDAETFVATLPAAISAATQEPFMARLLCYALLLGSEEPVRDAQVAALKQRIDPRSFAAFEKLRPDGAALAQGAKLPLLNLSLPALRGQSAEQYEEFRATLERLMEADRKISPLEFALGQMLRRHLNRHFSESADTPVQNKPLTRLAQECGILLSALAHVGQEGQDAAVRAFEAGVTELELNPAPTLSHVDAGDLAMAGDALDRLARLKPSQKRKLIAACAAAIARDGKVTVAEGEVFRAVSDALGVPMPPIPAGERDTARDPTTAVKA